MEVKAHGYTCSKGWCPSKFIKLIRLFSVTGFSRVRPTGIKSAPPLAWKCVSRHNGVQLFISHVAKWLRTRRFSQPTFRPSRATDHWLKCSGSQLFPKALVRLISNYSVVSVLKFIFYLLGYFISWQLVCLSFCPNRLFIWITYFFCRLFMWIAFFLLVVLMKKIFFVHIVSLKHRFF